MCVIGDGTLEPVTVAGSKLHDEEELRKIGENLPAPKAVKQTRQALSEKLFE